MNEPKQTKAKLFKRSVSFRDVIRKPSCATIPPRSPSIVAVVGGTSRSRLSCRLANIVQSYQFVYRVASNNCHADRPTELLQHDREGASLSVCVDEGGDGQSLVACSCLACKAFDDPLEVPPDLSKCPSAKRYHLSAEESTLGSRKGAYYVVVTVAHDLAGEFLVKQFELAAVGV